MSVLSVIGKLAQPLKKLAWPLIRAGAWKLAYQLAKWWLSKYTNKLFNRGGDMNPIEQLVRQIVDFVKKAKDLQGMVAIVTALLPVGSTVIGLIGYIGGKSRAEIKAEIKQVLDALIGEEADALVGPSGDILTIGETTLAGTTQEVISDALIEMILNTLMKDSE